MKTFACGDVVSGGAATFTADTEQKLLDDVAKHARHAHAMDTVPPEVVKQVREHIHEQPHA